MSMVEMRGCRALVVAAAGLALSGCVAAVPVQPTYTVVPGQGKTEANLRTDDAACRGGTSAQAAAVTADQYYQCMASRGESVVQQQPQAYPAYAYAAPAYVPYPYPVAAAYPYPYWGGGYGYPYGGYGGYGGYYGPYVGFGIGFRYGGFYGGGPGFYRGGGYYHGDGFRGGGFHGGGFRR